jgi:hypothetical protein
MWRGHRGASEPQAPLLGPSPSADVVTGVAWGPLVRPAHQPALPYLDSRGALEGRHRRRPGRCPWGSRFSPTVETAPQREAAWAAARAAGHRLRSSGAGPSRWFAWRSTSLKRRHPGSPNVAAMTPATHGDERAGAWSASACPGCGGDGSGPQARGALRNTRPGRCDPRSRGGLAPSGPGCSGAGRAELWAQADHAKPGTEAQRGRGRPLRAR